MPTNVRDIIKKLPPAQQKKIQDRADELIAEERSRQKRRRVRKRATART